MNKIKEFFAKNRIVKMTLLYAALVFVIAAGTGFAVSKSGLVADPVYYSGDCDYLTDYGTTGFKTDDIILDPGIYSLVVAYESNGFATIRPVDAQGVKTADEMLLTPYVNYAESYIYAKGKGGHISLSIDPAYEGMSLSLMAVSLNRLSGLSATYAAIIVMEVAAALYAILMLIRWLMGNAPKEKKLTVIGLLTIVVIASLGFLPGIFTGHISGGHDVEAHMGRIASVAFGIKNRIIPVKMYRYFANDFGYPMGVFYGDILLYPAAVLHMLGVPLYICYIFYAFMLNALTAIIAYNCFKVMVKERYAAVIVAGIYTLSLWRLNDLYIRAAVGEYSAMAFLPLIALGFYLASDKDVTYFEPKKKGMIIIFALATGFTGLIHTHMITCVMTVLFAVIFCLINIKEIVKQENITAILKAAGLTLLLNAGFIIPFADNYLRNDLVVKHLTKEIGGQGIYPIQLLSMAGDYAEISHSIDEGLSMAEEMPYSIGIGLLAVLILTLVVIINPGKNVISESEGAGMHKMRKTGLTLIALSVAALWLSTCYFPYDILAQKAAVISAVVGGVQFPWRYLVMATLMLCLATLFVFKYMNKNVIKIILGAAAVLSALFFMYRQNTADNKTVDGLNCDQIKVTLIASDIMYLPQDMDAEILKDRHIVISDEAPAVQDMGYDGLSYTVGVANDTDAEGYVTLPLIDYGGYHTFAMDDNGEYKLKDTYKLVSAEDGRVKLMIPAGSSDIVEVRYKEPWYYRVAECLSLITLIIAVYLWKRKLTSTT